jgi:hypothetical protein
VKVLQLSTTPTPSASAQGIHSHFPFKFLDSTKPHFYLPYLPSLNFKSSLVQGLQPFDSLNQSLKAFLQFTNESLDHLQAHHYGVAFEI